jgi:hypothetical protein
MTLGVGTAEYAVKSAQCRRLAAGVANQKDHTIASLLTLAVEFERGHSGGGRRSSGKAN